MLDLRIVVDGVAVVSRRMEALAGRAEDLRPAWLYVQEEFFKSRRRTFRSEGASDGMPWTRLALSTARGRASAGFPPFHPILVRTKRLMRSLTERGGDNLTVGTPRSLALGSDVEYLRYHKHGTSRMPRRSPVDFTDADKHALVRPVRRYVLGHDISAPVRSRPGR